MIWQINKNRRKSWFYDFLWFRLKVRLTRNRKIVLIHPYLSLTDWLTHVSLIRMARHLLYICYAFIGLFLMSRLQSGDVHVHGEAAALLDLRDHARQDHLRHHLCHWSSQWLKQVLRYEHMKMLLLCLCRKLWQTNQPTSQPSDRHGDSS